MKGFLKFIAVIIVIALIVVGVGYVLLNFGQKVDVQWTQADLDKLEENIGVKVNNINDLSIENIARGDYTVKEARSVDTSITSAEFSAMVASANDVSGPVRDFKLDFTGADKLELSFKLSPDVAKLIKEAGIIDSLRANTAGIIMLSLIKGNVISLTNALENFLSALVDNKPIYASGSLTKSGANEVSVRIDSIKLGVISLGRSILDEVESATETFVNDFITSANGFSIEELRVEDGNIYYKGTMPSEINGIPIE